MKRIIDKQAILERVDDDEELLAEIIGLFLEDCPRLLAEIQEAVGQQNAHQLKVAAHTLKGSVGNFAAQPAFDAAARLELMGHQAEFSEAVRAYEVLHEEIECVKVELVKLAPQASSA